MILEAIQFAATSAVTPKEFRPFIRSSVSLWARARRCAQEWRSHEQNCHAVIRDAVNAMRDKRTAVVLGSGLLRDVPIEFLAKQFDTVVLVDLVHVASVRAWLTMKRLRNVRLISRDIGGTDEPLAFLRQVPYLDLVISANVLSQIGVGAKRRLGNDMSGVPKALIQAHLDGLSALPCKAVLLTDISYQVTNRQGDVIEEDDLLCGVPVPPHGKEWIWPVAPFGELGKDRQAVHRVIAARHNY